MRTALCEEVKAKGQLSSPNVTGGQRWNGRVLRDLFEEPKFSAVAEELWADDPKDLASIKKVFSALAGADGSSRAKAVNTSGTGQTVAGKYDPSLSMASVVSRARSVNRGQMSPTIAGIDLVGTWLLRKSTQVQSRAVDQITSEFINNPRPRRRSAGAVQPGHSGRLHPHVDPEMWRAGADAAAAAGRGGERRPDPRRHPARLWPAGSDDTARRQSVVVSIYSGGIRWARMIYPGDNWGRAPQILRHPFGCFSRLRDCNKNVKRQFSRNAQKLVMP